MELWDKISYVLFWWWNRFPLKHRVTDSLSIMKMTGFGVLRTSVQTL